MKNVSISLTNQQATEIELQVASGDYASVSEVIRAALREFLGRPAGPSAEQIEADIAAYLAGRAAGAPLIDADDAEAIVRARITE